VTLTEAPLGRADPDGKELVDLPPGEATPEEPPRPPGDQLQASDFESGSPQDPRNPVRQVGATAMILVTAIAGALVLHLVLISGLEHRSAQQRSYDRFRYELAQGTAPVAQTERSGQLVELGSPVALLEIPSLHVREVVGEGTTSTVLMDGPGHRRDTPLPGQSGSSVIMGRAAAYGGPFKHLHELKPGATITVTTGQGVSKYTVIDKRESGDPSPPPLASGKGRLVLETATGLPFIPGGILRVDANLDTQTFPTPASVIPSGALPSSEEALGTDTSTLWALVLWLEALVLVAVAIVWSWHRWGRHQTWIVLAPLALLISLYVVNEFMRLLPNLM
jgi:LPXTG-site transpeptidase (sortase) family protein